jgi:hypothetical protein
MSRQQAAAAAADEEVEAGKLHKKHSVSFR